MALMSSEYIVPGPIHEAKFIRRENRFIVYVEHFGRPVRCHLPNPGRMIELIEEGRTVYIRYSDKKSRKTKASMIAIRINDEIIQLDSNFVATWVPHLINNKIIPEFKHYHIIKQEITYGKHRFDFLMGDPKNREIYVEIKSTTRVIKGRACFPDAVSQRAYLHVKTLGQLSSQNIPTMTIFVVFRNAAIFGTCEDIDPKFSQQFWQSRTMGMDAYAILASTRLLDNNGELSLSISYQKLLEISEG